ncbi:MAG: hypothetical protein J7K90_03935 [Desulfuromusa sp.]|nr:hypothetical protein [Desulfuromusa sp.]
MFLIKSVLSTLLVTMILVTPAFAIDAAITYKSGLFVLSFLGFCTLVVIAQLIPAVLMLIGMTKDVPEGLARKRA